jgi:hypothetical protein
VTAYKDLLDNLFRHAPNLGFVLIYVVIGLALLSLVLMILLMTVGKKIAVSLDPLFRHLLEKARPHLYWTSDLPSFKGDRARHYVLMVAKPDRYVDIAKVENFNFAERLGPRLYFAARVIGNAFFYLERLALYVFCFVGVLAYFNLLRNLGLFSLGSIDIASQFRFWWESKPSRIWELALGTLCALLGLVTLWLRRQLLPRFEKTIVPTVNIQLPFRPSPTLLQCAHSFHLGVCIAFPLLYQNKMRRAGVQVSLAEIRPYQRVVCILYSVGVFALALGILVYSALCILGFLNP